jgi:hypothetical protein
MEADSKAVPSVFWKPILTRDRARSALSFGCRSIEFSRKILVVTTTYDKIYSNNIEEEYEIVVNRVIVFIGWSLSTLFLVIALAGLVTPGAGKLMSLAMIGWCLIFLPPFWKKTIQYGLPKNIISALHYLVCQVNDWDAN